GFVFGHDPVHGEISRRLGGVIGVAGGQAVEALVKGASVPQTGVVATALGLVALVFGATGVFAELQDGLNVIWKAPPRKINGVLAFFRTRAISVAVVLGIGLLVLASLMVSVALSALGEGVGQPLNSAFSFVVTAVLFALIFKLLPDVKVTWRDVRVGATITAVLFTLGNYALGLVLGQAMILSTFGAAASLAAFLLWVYYSSMILLIGAELSHAISVRARGPAVAVVGA
ncbi:MAG: YihY/virulence factor BrkB family protein, partial [Myxococcaceae bacterium]